MLIINKRSDIKKAVSDVRTSFTTQYIQSCTFHRMAVDQYQNQYTVALNLKYDFIFARFKSTCVLKNNLKPKGPRVQYQVIIVHRIYSTNIFIKAIKLQILHFILFSKSIFKSIS